MEVIPVLDLKDGIVVHARMGMRSQYGPIKTPLSPTSNPSDVARGLLSVFPFKIFYIADLDAIERKGNNNSALIELRTAFPDLVFWVDNGVADLAGAERWLDADLGHLVLGSETQKDGELIRHLHRDDRVILSLDFRGDAFLGPATLLNDINIMAGEDHRHDARPRRQRNRARHGPARCHQGKRSGKGQVYAAGGVRDADDLAELTRAGIAGALVATCLHNGKLTGAQIARL